MVRRSSRKRAPVDYTEVGDENLAVENNISASLGAQIPPAKRIRGQGGRGCGKKEIKVGCKVHKDFDGTYFRGEVLSIDRCSTKPSKKLYHVVYSDGDREDLYESELRPWLIDPPPPKECSKAAPTGKALSNTCKKSRNANSTVAQTKSSKRVNKRQKAIGQIIRKRSKSQRVQKLCEPKKARSAYQLFKLLPENKGASAKDTKAAWKQLGLFLQEQKTKAALVAEMTSVAQKLVLWYEQEASAVEAAMKVEWEDDIEGGNALRAAMSRKSDMDGSLSNAKDRHFGRSYAYSMTEHCKRMRETIVSLPPTKERSKNVTVAKAALEQAESVLSRAMQERASAPTVPANLTSSGTLRKAVEKRLDKATEAARQDRDQKQKTMHTAMSAFARVEELCARAQAALAKGQARVAALKRALSRQLADAVVDGLESATQSGNAGVCVCVCVCVRDVIG